MKALIIVDVQNDFCQGISKGNEVIEPLNRLIYFAKKNRWLVIASRDWHSKTALSNKNWNPHCIKGTDGAKFHPELKINSGVKIISKGKLGVGKISYSVFNCDDLNLQNFLKQNKVREILFGGLATDYCVRYSALDSVKMGFLLP